MSDFLTQGAYGLYVWPAYGVSLLALVLMTWFTLASYRKAKRALARLEGKEQKTDLQVSETNL